jgi:hypothetical protein
LPWVGADRSLVIDAGWETVAKTALGFLEKHGAGA